MQLASSSETSITGMVTPVGGFSVQPSRSQISLMAAEARERRMLCSVIGIAVGIVSTIRVSRRCVSASARVARTWGEFTMVKACQMISASMNVNIEERENDSRCG